MQINEALFTGTEGYVLKPPSLRQDGLGNRPSGKVRLELEVFGASDLPVPAGRTEDEIRWVFESVGSMEPSVLNPHSRVCKAVCDLYLAAS